MYYMSERFHVLILDWSQVLGQCTGTPPQGQAKVPKKPSNLLGHRFRGQVLTSCTQYMHVIVANHQVDESCFVCFFVLGVHHFHTDFQQGQDR